MAVGRVSLTAAIWRIAAAVAVMLSAGVVTGSYGQTTTPAPARTLMLATRDIGPLDDCGASPPTTWSAEAPKGLTPINDGDTLWNLAKANLGASGRYPEIIYYNNILALHGAPNARPITDRDVLRSGMRIYIPPKDLWTDQKMPNGIDPFWRQSTQAGSVGDFSGETIRVSGSGRLFDLTVRSAECMRKAGFHGDVLITIDDPVDVVDKPSRSIAGMHDLCTQKSDLVMVSLSPDSIEESLPASGCSKNDPRFHLIPVAVEPIVIAVSRDNPMIGRGTDGEISLDSIPELEKLLNAEKWSEFASGTNRRIQTDPDHDKIKRFFPSRRGGLFNALAQILFNGSALSISTKHMPSTNVPVSELDTKSAIMANGEAGSLSVFSFFYYKKYNKYSKSQLSAVKLEGHEPGEPAWRLVHVLYLGFLLDENKKEAKCYFAQHYLGDPDRAKRAKELEPFGLFPLSSDEMGKAAHDLSEVCRNTPPDRAVGSGSR